MKSICVYCSSSSALDAHYTTAAVEFGTLLGQRGLTLVYGGASVGLMGQLARSVQRAGGRVVGVIPQSLRDREIAYEAADELIVTRDLRERKAIMESRTTRTELVSLRTRRTGIRLTSSRYFRNR